MDLYFRYSIFRLKFIIVTWFNHQEHTSEAYRNQRSLSNEISNEVWTYPGDICRSLLLDGYDVVLGVVKCQGRRLMLGFRAVGLLRTPFAVIAESIPKPSSNESGLALFPVADDMSFRFIGFIPSPSHSS